MLYTVADARERVAPFVLTGGSCPDSSTVLSRINEATERLLDEGRADWVQTQRRFRVCTDSGCVTLPREFISARIVNVNCGPADLFPRHYEYLEWGPWEEGCGEHRGIDLKDEGDGFPTFFDIPDAGDDTDYFLYAASTSEADRTKTILIRGRKKNGEEVLQSSGSPGEELPIALWDNGTEGSLSVYPTPLTAASFGSIHSVHLPAGRRGYVSLFAVNPVNHAMFFLGKYHPDESVPGYRRYRILGADGTTDHRIDLLCKVRFIKATRDDEVLLIQNLNALKLMIMAIREENSGNLEQALVLEAKAQAALANQLANERSGDPILRVQDAFPMASFPNVI